MKNFVRQIIVFLFLCFLSAISLSQIALVEIKNSWVHLNSTDSIYTEDDTGRHAKICFTEDDQIKIVQLVDSFHFWDMPDNPKSPNNARIEPCPGITTFHIKTKDHDKVVRFPCLFENEVERNNIRGLERAIFQIVYQKPEYRALPRRRFFHL